MIGRPLAEAQAIYAQYDRQAAVHVAARQRLPRARPTASATPCFTMARAGIGISGRARYVFAKGAGPCSLEEAKQRIRDPAHPWFGGCARPRQHPHRPERADPGLGRTAHQTVDARVLARRRSSRCCRCTTVWSARSRPGTGRADRPAGLRSGRARRFRCAPTSSLAAHWGDAKHTWQELRRTADRRAGAHLPRGAARPSRNRGRPHLRALPARPAGRQRGSQPLQRRMAAPALPGCLHPTRAWRKRTSPGRRRGSRSRQELARHHLRGKPTCCHQTNPLPGIPQP